MADALAYEKADELGNPIKRLTASSNKSATSATARRPRKQGKVKQHQVSATVNVPADIVTVSSDDEDLSYVATDYYSDAGDSDGTSDTWWPNEVRSDAVDALPTNAEVLFVLFRFYFYFDTSLDRRPVACEDGP